MDNQITKARLKMARQLAEEELGSSDPEIIAALLQSLATDALCQTIEVQTEKMTDCLVACTAEIGN